MPGSQLVLLFVEFIFLLFSSFLQSPLFIKGSTGFSFNSSFSVNHSRHDEKVSLFEEENPVPPPFGHLSVQEIQTAILTGDKEKLLKYHCSDFIYSKFFFTVRFLFS
jgi:hypothetical protein